MRKLNYLPRASANIADWLRRVSFSLNHTKEIWLDIWASLSVSLFPSVSVCLAFPPSSSHSHSFLSPLDLSIIIGIL